jgi:hypothetical protein
LRGQSRVPRISPVAGRDADGVRGGGVWGAVVSAARFLKPCPFCGGKAQLKPDEVGSGGQHVPPYYAGCWHCRIMFTEEDADDAVTAWNTRADFGLVEALSQLLRDIEPMEQAAGVRTASGDAARATLARARGEQP